MRSNQLAIVVGDRLNAPRASLKYIAKKIVEKFSLKLEIHDDDQIFYEWNTLINEAEKYDSRENLIKFVKGIIENVSNGNIYQRIASIPISNFVDLTINRSLLPALNTAHKSPKLHAFKSQFLGAWQQSNPTEPNLFFCFGDLDERFPLVGLHEQILIHPQNRIQIENMIEMITDKDLLLLDISAFEAEYMLHLNYLVSSASKVVNTNDPNQDWLYWSRRGVVVLNTSTVEILDFLVPAKTNFLAGLGVAIPRMKLIDAARHKQYDCFLCYFSRDKAFAKRLENDLILRGLRIWRDDNKIDVGDSFTDKIQEGLKDSYTFIILLSGETLQRPWVKEELRAAYNLRLAEELKILPVLYEDCEIPPFLSDYKYADFRDEKRYTEQLGLLERSISNAVKLARRKI